MVSSLTSPSKISTAAKNYLADGYAPLPLHSAYDETISEERRGKAPLHSDWSHTPMPTEKDIVDYFGGNKDVNLGIRTGIISKCVAFDVDGENGLACWNEKLKKDKKIEKLVQNTWVITTGNGIR